MIDKLLEIMITKMFKVIDSMSSRDHINGTRRYIDLYYKQFGEKHKSVIEIYFKTRVKLVKQAYGNSKKQI